jgi:predicted RND superfamily exporter protein
VEYFGERLEFRRDADFAIEHLTSPYVIGYSLGAGESSGINEPEYLRKLDDFANWLRAQPAVHHVSTFTDVMKRLNKNMHGDDPAYYRLPDERELAAQYLLLYEMSLPYGLDVNDQVNVDKSATRLEVTLRNIDFKILKRLKADSEAWLEKNALPAMRAEAAGPAVMFAYIAERNIYAMIRGTAIAFTLITLVLVISLRSVKIGAISLLPNLVPAAMAFGIWALVSGEVGFAVSIVASVSIGIIVDDTVHFLSKYLRARRELGLGSADAVRYAFRTVGVALCVTSAILIVGFAALATSAFWPNATLGLLTALAIACALVADFLLLPPLLMALDSK